MSFTDRYPQGKKILFIGLLESSHTQNWISLLDEQPWNIRLFAMPTGYVKKNWQIPTYLSHPNPPNFPNSNVYSCLYHLHKDMISTKPTFFLSLFRIMYNLIFKVLRKFNEIIDAPFEIKDIVNYRSPETWLAKIIQEWQPDIIHTLGVFDFQGGEFYYKVRKKYHLEKNGKWVLQTRGGSDLTLRQHDPPTAEILSKILQESDVIISDNLTNIEYAKAVGISHEKFALITPIPGSGGINIEIMKNLTGKTSKRRLILIPKAYESMWSKSLPILEALQHCWQDIQPCQVHFLATDEETVSYTKSLPSYIKENIIIHGRLSHSETINLMRKARVLLAPSLVDGIPNSLYEAMACGALPIVSPIETIASLVENEKHVLFARNLYPYEISEALTRAMLNDGLVDTITENNFAFVKKIADRNTVREKVVNFYQYL